MPTVPRFSAFDPAVRMALADEDRRSYLASERPFPIETDKFYHPSPELSIKHRKNVRNFYRNEKINVYGSVKRNSSDQRGTEGANLTRNGRILHKIVENSVEICYHFVY